MSRRRGVTICLKARSPPSLSQKNPHFLKDVLRHSIVQDNKVFPCAPIRCIGYMGKNKGTVERPSLFHTASRASAGLESLAVCTWFKRCQPRATACNVASQSTSTGGICAFPRLLDPGTSFLSEVS